MKKCFSLALACALIVALAFSATAFAAPAAISADDFMINVGKTSINLLTDSVDSILKASDKKMVYKESDDRNDLNYFIKAKEATFATHKKDDVYASAAFLTSKGATSRGIKLGSTESALLKAYPATDDTWDSGKEMLYYYQAANAPDTLSAADKKNLDSIRPNYYYKIIFTVNKKSKRVTDITFIEWY